MRLALEMAFKARRSAVWRVGVRRAGIPELTELIKHKGVGPYFITPCATATRSAMTDAQNRCVVKNATAHGVIRLGNTYKNVCKISRKSLTDARQAGCNCNGGGVDSLMKTSMFGSVFQSATAIWRDPYRQTDSETSRRKDRPAYRRESTRGYGPSKSATATSGGADR